MLVVKVNSKNKKKKIEKNCFSSLLLVTRVRSHGYVQVSFNVVKKDMDALGYKSESKLFSIASQQRTEHSETNPVDNY